MSLKLDDATLAQRIAAGAGAILKLSLIHI